jgi:putative SOS response-associated peptidase YedK
MCGRYTLYHDEEDLSALFDLDAFAVAPRYNVAPTQTVPIVRAGEGGRRERLDARWGLVPAWVKDPRTFKALLFNARAETVAEKPSFRDAARRARCAVPASGFYEWTVGEDGRKQPWYVHRRDGAPMVFAGLYAERGDGAPSVSATVLTTEPNATMAALHDRMPVVLDPAAIARWLDPAQRDPHALDDLLAPCPDDWLEAYPVGPEVGNARVDDPRLIQRA